MKKTSEKKKILILIILIILIIVGLQIFTKSRASKTQDITINFQDNGGLLSNETSIAQAINEGESGVSLVLPEFANDKRVGKYIIIKKDIITDADSTLENTTVENIKAENTIGENTIVENTTVENTMAENTTVEKTMAENTTVETLEMQPGEKIYLTQEEIEKSQIDLKVEYDIIEINEEKLYNKKLIYSEGKNNILTVLGYMPVDTNLEVTEADITNVQEEIYNNYGDKEIIANYAVKLISNEKEYNPSEYTQKLTIEISTDNNQIEILEVDSNKVQKVANVKINEGIASFETEEIKTYLILQSKSEVMTIAEETGSDEALTNDETTGNDAISVVTVGGEEAKFEIDDYESDKNYYLGLNYTENNLKENTDKYTESNLKDVTINYYGYDYDLTEFTKPEEYDVSLNATAQRTATGSISTSQTGWGWNQTTYYSRTDTVTITVSGLNALQQQYPNGKADSTWTLEAQIPNNNFSNYYYADGTASANSGVSVSLGTNTITVTGDDSSSLLTNGDTCTFTFKVTFRATNRNYINNTSFTTLTVNSFKTIITVGDYTPYGTISDTEQQTLVSYRKCVPVDSNGNISVELIDNPFMNRPLERGFNGWKTNNSKYSSNISTNSNTFVQTLKTNANNIKDSSGNYVIDLYPDWIEANVIFVSSSGSSSNSGKTPNSPINNNWTNINSKINSNIKTCTKASNREVNIIVLMQGTLDASGLTGPNTAYTLTSLYNGKNYGSTSTYLSAGSSNVTLDSDLQLDYLYIYSSASYSSSRSTTDGTSAVSPCIYGNMYNLRIGRGITPTNSSNCTWAQVQGGYYNHSSSEYKLVMESGKYYTVQLFRAGNVSNTTTSNGTLVIGNDIDRKNNNNDNMRIYNRMAEKTSRETNKPYTQNDSEALITNMIIKSGTIGVDYFNSASTSDSSERNYAGIYVGGHGQTGYDKSDRKLIVEGGNIANVIGGLDVEASDMYKTYIYIKDGNIINITGGAGYTHTYGDRIIQVTGGCIKYSISGGSNGVAANSSSNNGQLTGNSLIYVGGNAHVGASYTIDTSGNKQIAETDTSLLLYGVNAGSVCGGANGNGSYAGQTDGSYIIIDGNAVVHNNVFGGGNYGIIGSSSGGSSTDNPILTFSNESSSFQTEKEYLISLDATGGNALAANGTTTTNNFLSTSAEPGNSAKWIFESAGNNQYYIKNAETGGYIYLTNVSSYSEVTADATISTSNKTAFSMSGTNSKQLSCQVSYSNYWGGGTQTATVYLGYDYQGNWNASNNYYNDFTSELYLLTYKLNSKDEDENDSETVVNIRVFGGTIKNNIYGGANQNNIYGTVDLTMKNGIVNGVVYGGSNIKGTISGSTLINISGGQLGTASGQSTSDYTSTDALFGGGLGSETKVSGRALLNIQDTDNNLNIYGNVYGGSSLGTMSGNITVNIKDSPTITNVIDINGYVFGGGKGNTSTAAVVSGNITINVDGSKLNNCNVFGASNINGTTPGNITVKIGENNESILYGVYGGGNQASIGTDTQSVKVYLLSNANVTNAFNGSKSADLLSSGENDTTREIYLQGGTVENMYGGSDSSGTVTASHVYVENGNASNVYGGNNQGGTTITTNVKIKGGIIQNVYGGGEKAQSTTSNVITTGGTTSNIYGGGNQAGVTTTNVTTNGGNIGNVFGGSNTSGDVETSNVTTNESSGNDDSNTSIKMTVETTAQKAETWQSTTYPTVATLKIVLTNNTSKEISKWSAYIYAPDSVLNYNYTSSDIEVNNGTYKLTEKNKYYGTNPIPANGTLTIEFGIFSYQDVEEFSVGYGMNGTNSDGEAVSSSNSIIQNVYGGNNQGGITKTPNVIINGGGVQNVYGGGNQAVCEVTNVTINGNVAQYVYGGGNQAGINTDTNVVISGATIGKNVYGGGNQGTVTGNTNVRIKNSTLKANLYAGGNGSAATVYGNTNLIMEGKNEVTNSVFGGGNQAATGTEAQNNSTSTVNIVGGIIGGNVYGGANTSVVYGKTQTNLGYDAVGNTSLEIGDIKISGTVFGGGEANASGSEVFDFDFISVTVQIDILIDAKGYDNFSILGSIFGSGNASSTSGKSYITIRNYGTPDKPQSNVSLQRTDCATIENSALSLSGTTDRTNEYSAVFFSISRVDQVKLKNNSTLFLCNGANLLKELDSVVDIDGNEEKGSVIINEDTGEVTKNVDNRIYMMEGKNLNVALNEKATIYGKVQGMFFFGLFTNRNNPATSTGLYHSSYNNGDALTNAGTFVSNSYVIAEHLTNPEHDIKVDGFYTNYNNENNIKVNYITPTPDEDVYYMWVAGEKMDVKVFNIEMVASKYATLGTYDLALTEFSEPNLKFYISGFSSGLANDISLISPDEIESVEPDENKANTQFGLTMKTGNIGWQNKGTTNFLTDNGGTYTGTTNYNADNTNYTPRLNFYFYHSQNLTVKKALGEVKIRLQVWTPVDDLNYKISYIDINVTLSTALFQDEYYEAAMTPGQEYELFTTTDTTITNHSTLSAYYSLMLQNFSDKDYYEEYKNYQRVLVSRDSDNSPYVFPENTKLTMLDIATNQYYYYIVTAEDVANKKYIYKLSDFISMGSKDDKFDETEMYEQYYKKDENLIYENFIFHVNLENTTITENIIDNSLLMELRNQDDQTIIGVLGIERENMLYNVYCDKDATIKVSGTIDPETIYLGNSIKLNVTTKFTQELLGSKTIYDTQYFDNKLGIKISIYDSNGNRLNNDSLLGINFELNGETYYPRVDGTTRINIADKVTDVLAKIQLNTENNKTWATGDYKIRIESFGSSDGIYYGLTASDTVELDVRIINQSFGLKAFTADSDKIIEKDSGKTSSGSESIATTLQYSSSLNNPNIAISLYRRDYTEEFSQEYNLVDLKDYVSTELKATKREKEYVVSTNPVETTTYFLILKQNLITGTYKLVYKLYDGDVYIGEVYEYMIIK